MKCSSLVTRIYSSTKKYLKTLSINLRIKQQIEIDPLESRNESVGNNIMKNKFSREGTHFHFLSLHMPRIEWEICVTLKWHFTLSFEHFSFSLDKFQPIVNVAWHKRMREWKNDKTECMRRKKKRIKKSHKKWNSARGTNKKMNFSAN